MSSDPVTVHFEPYIHLAGLSHEAALIAWGGFFFEPGGQGGGAKSQEAKDGELMLVDDSDLDAIEPGRNGSIGERSTPYGKAEVEVRDAGGDMAARATVADANHAWIQGLQPDTEYTYSIHVDGQPWAAGELHDWVTDDDGRMNLRAAGRHYDNRFRTHPATDEARSLVFGVLGDFGVGVRTREAAGRRQYELAGALERAVAQYGARLILTTGDNIYHMDEVSDATGDEDDDWFFTFYQPYRYLLNRIPFYPTVGNHDTDDSEKSDDRDQVSDNYYLRLRFNGQTEAKRASVDPGMFYVFPYGSDVEFVCVDTTRDADNHLRYFEHDKQYKFLEEALPPANGGHVPWRIPFAHHPTYCAGPKHGNTEGMAEILAPLFEQAAVRLVLAGHEHNFQYSQANGCHYVLSGAGGQLREESPTGFAQAHTSAWAVTGHFLIVELGSDQAIVRSLAAGADAEPQPIELRTPDNESYPTPIVFPR